MKAIHIITILVFSGISSCRTTSIIKSNIVNKESVDPRGTPMLLGKSTRQRLQEYPYGSWFNKNYSDYKLDSVTAELLKSKLTNKRFMIFMGTWCGDSRQEVPKIYKLLDYCGIENSSIQLINVNIYDSVYKQSPTHEEKGLNIHRVPDLLVYENNTEIGRIVEKPVVSWEKDLLAITRGDHYVANYKIVTYLQQLFEVVPIEQIEKEIVKIADSLKPHLNKNEGLQSFANVLFASDQRLKAMLVLRLNTMLYPRSADAFVSLADAYLKNDERFKAKESYEHALLIQPGHPKAVTMLAQLVK
jgi:hypothetical protein